MPREAINHAIGRVSQNCAQLESVVAIVAWGLAGLQQDVARIVVPNNMDAMLGLIKSLLPIRVADDDLRKSVTGWCGRVKVAYTERSAVIHSLWVEHEPPGTYFRAHLKPLKDTLETRTLDDLSKLAETLLHLGTIGAGEFLQDLVDAAPGPWSAGPSLPTHKRPSEWQ